MEIISNLPDVDYFKVDAISNSLLGHMKPTPAHCLEYQNNPPERTDAMEFGAALHSLVLEPELFDNVYAVEPNIKRLTKAQKDAAKPSAPTIALMEQWEEWEAAHPNCIGIKADNYEKMVKMRDAIMANKASASVLTKGEKELSLFWTDEQTGADMKCRVDNYFNGYVVDLKTTTDASPTGFGKAVGNYGYHRQAALYSDGVEACFGEKPKGFIFVPVEKEPPFLSAAYILDDASFQQGYDEYRELLAQYIVCKLSKNWHGYSETVNEISLPGWYKP
jgi:hypothetical protein